MVNRTRRPSLYERSVTSDAGPPLALGDSAASTGSCPARQQRTLVNRRKALCRSLRMLPGADSCQLGSPSVGPPLDARHHQQQRQQPCHACQYAPWHAEGLAVVQRMQPGQHGVSGRLLARIALGHHLAALCMDPQIAPRKALAGPTWQPGPDTEDRAMGWRRVHPPRRGLWPVRVHAGQHLVQRQQRHAWLQRGLGRWHRQRWTQTCQW